MPVETELFRSNRLVDPQLQLWGWEVPVYFFLGGLAAGILVLTAIMALRQKERSRWSRWLIFAAPVVLSAGMFALFLDLENKANVLRFYMAFQPQSVESWGSWILLAIYPVSILLGLADLTDGEAKKLGGWGPLRVTRLGQLIAPLRRLATPRIRGLRWSAIGLGTALGVYTGMLLGSFTARPLWNSALLAPVFLLSALATGAAFILLFGLSADERRRLGRTLVVTLGLEALMVAFFVIHMRAGGADGAAAAAQLLGGKYTAAFWALAVVVGLLVPIVVGLAQRRWKLPLTRVAPVLVLTGGFALRWIVVTAGQA